MSIVAFRSHDPQIAVLAPDAFPVLTTTPVVVYMQRDRTLLTHSLKDLIWGFHT
jgi:hypothetical protein